MSEVSRRRGPPLVATWGRWAIGTIALALAAALLADASIALSHSGRTMSGMAPVAAAGVALVSAILWATLRSEELRLARELRTARSGSSVLRDMVVRRRARGSVLSRLLETKLGTAAILLADGDRSEALSAFASGSVLVRGGRIEALRAIVEADLDRALGTALARERSVTRLRGTKPTGNREADLYRLHVLVKALLEQGDAESGHEVAMEILASRDDEAAVYAVWLATWFELDTPGTEGELRLATLLARAHGAEKLVEKLESRLATIARPLQEK